MSNEIGGISSSEANQMLDEAAIEGVLEKVKETDPESAHKIESYLAIQQTMHRGPMPSPEDLKNYALTQPDLPERMMQMAEKSLDGKIRQHDKILELKQKEIDLRTLEVSNEDNAHKRETKIHYFNLTLAFVSVMVCILGSFYMGLQGHKEIALTIGGTTVVGIVGAFLWNRFTSKNKLEIQKPESINGSEE